MSDKKSNSKSIRVSDKVMNYILGYRGAGFNEKFENIILDAMESEDERIRTLEMYDKSIEDVRDRYYLLCDKLRQLEPMVQACLHINSRIKQLNIEFDECISKVSLDPEDLEKN